MKNKFVTAMLFLESLRDCGTLNRHEHVRISEMCEELAEMYHKLLQEGH